MCAIGKLYLILVVVALISFVGRYASAKEKVKININTASAKELLKLSQIGEKGR